MRDAIKVATVVLTVTVIFTLVAPFIGYAVDAYFDWAWHVMGRPI